MEVALEFYSSLWMRATALYDTNVTAPNGSHNNQPMVWGWSSIVGDICYLFVSHISHVNHGVE